MKYFYLFLFLLFLYKPANSQSVKPYKDKNIIRAGYGFCLSGTGDIPGHQVILGMQNQLSHHSMLDLRFCGTWMESTISWGNNYAVTQESKGISLEADYGFALKWWRLAFYPSIGPALRYSREVHPVYISVSYDKYGNISNFEAPVKAGNVLQIGGTGGLNFDIRATQSLSLGLRTSAQVYNGGQTIAFIGLTIKNTKWHF